MIPEKLPEKNGTKIEKKKEKKKMFLNIHKFLFEKFTSIASKTETVTRDAKFFENAGLHNHKIFVYEIPCTQNRFRCMSVHVEIVHVKQQTCTLLIAAHKG